MKITSKAELQELTETVSALATLKFFPQNEQAIAAIIELVGEMVSSMDHARWLVRRMLELFDEWPGPVSLRVTYTDRYPAQDSPTEDPPHPFWIEHVADVLQLPPAPPDPDRIRTSGPWPEDLLLKPRLPVRKTLPEQPILVPGKDFKPITADDIEEARRNLKR